MRRKLLSSIDTSDMVGLRDRAMLAVLVYNTYRHEAVAMHRLGNFYNARTVYGVASTVMDRNREGKKSRIRSG